MDININLRQTEGEELEHKVLLRILVTKINFANANNQYLFYCFTLFDIEKPKTYAHII